MLAVDGPRTWLAVSPGVKRGERILYRRALENGLRFGVLDGLMRAARKPAGSRRVCGRGCSKALRLSDMKCSGTEEADQSD